MKYRILSLALIFVLGCNNATNKDPIQEEPSDTNKQIKGPVPDSVRDSLIADSIAKNIKMDSMLLGRHSLTMQWLSFDDQVPGIAFINKTDSSWYSIKGEHKNNKGFLKIDGIIKPVNEKELLFNGTIEYSINTLVEGEVCRKEGMQTFLSTKNRKYWRLQNMQGCGGTTDYVDIFF